MEKYGISAARMRELMSVCEQYPEMLRALNDARAGVRDEPPKGNAAARIVKDPTGARAARVADSYTRRRVRIVETAAEAACPSAALRRCLLISVTRNRGYERLGRVPCGRRQFYALRREFFLELDARLREDEEDVKGSHGGE